MSPQMKNLFSSFDEGYGYIPSAAVGHSLKEYQFVRKLGWATSSSVWLALDKLAKTRKFYALKHLTSQATAQIAQGGSKEFDVFLKAGSANPTSPGFNHCLSLERCFTVHSPAGIHTCFVTEALSSSLAKLREPGENRFTLPIAKRITKQILALDYLHSECGYIHTDIKADNILTSIPEPVASRIERYVLENDAVICGPPLQLKSEESLVFSRSQPLPYFDLGGSLEEISVRLVDYGQATPTGQPMRDGFCQPDILRAPEVTLKYPWTSTIDIWTVGCLLFELLTEKQLFNQDTGNDYSHALDLQHIEECLGAFPPEFLKDCKDRDKYFDGQGKLLNTDSDFEPTPIEDILRALEAIDEDEIPGTADFLRKCLTIDPKLRPNAKELIKDGWLM